MIKSSLLASFLIAMIFRSYVKSFQSPFHYNRRHRFSTQPLSSSLILDIPIQLQGFQDIASRYDIILFDQFGVLHDGKTLFPGVLKVLQQLQNLNKTLGVVSNTSRRSIDAIKAMTQLDVPSNTFESFITSGELAFNYVNNKYSHRETSCTVLTWKGTQVSFLSTLNIKLAPPETADFIYLHGSESMQVSEHSSQSTPLDLINTGVLDASIETMLRVALRRNLPLICANSDHSAVSNDRLLYMPGLIAERYEEMGGEVFHFGKPYKPVFETAIDECLSIRNQISTNIDTSTPVAAAVETVVTTSKTTCSSFDMNPMRERMRDLTLRRQRSRILHVGDSLSHDILGAKNAYIDSLLISSHGIHRDKLHPSSPFSMKTDTEYSSHPYYRNDQSKLGDNSLIFRVCQLCDDMEIVRPTYILPTVQWAPYS